MHYCLHDARKLTSNDMALLLVRYFKQHMKKRFLGSILYVSLVLKKVSSPFFNVYARAFILYIF